MSDKKRRDITLGEMQDECTKIGGICVGIKNITEDCKYLAVCPFQSAKRKMCALNLTDLPRFNEAQMAFWRGWYAVGARTAEKYNNKNQITILDNKGVLIAHAIGVDVVEKMGLNGFETLDLAELLGKDAT